MFHLDRDAFVAWLDLDGDWEATLQLLEGDANEDLVFDAAYRALLHAVPEATTPQFFGTVSELVVLWPYLQEAMLVGFLVEHGHDPNRFVRMV